MENKAPKGAAFVTGAAKGLGLAIASMLAEEHYQVVMADVEAETLVSASKSIPGETIPLTLDISDYQAVVDACGRISKDIGPISVLINNAGIISFAKLLEVTPSEWRRVMSVNLDGALYISQQLVPGMKELGWGRIINISSLAMKVGGLYVGTAYCASKGGLGALTFSLARELAPNGITVNAVAPVHLPTPMINMNEDHFGSKFNQQFIETVPVKRICSVKEVAHVVKFLISPLSGFITGEVIDINGGLHMD